MDYEKAYKELVKDFNAVLNLDSIKQNGAVPVEDIVKMIPELKETEDNSIKEELINFLNTYIYAHGCTEMLKWVSWIERLVKEPVEPKFKVGDWIVYNRNNSSREILYVYDIRDGRYYFNDNIHYSWSIKECDEKSHLWTIQDAKDGDVLSYVTDEGDLWIMIYKSLYEPYEGHVHYHALLINGNFDYKGTCCIFIDDLKPSTKEQRDTLFKAMADTGYAFDFEKKELKKIENNPHKQKCGEDEQKTALSDYDLSMIDNLIMDETCPLDSEYISWLKSLKNKIIPQHKQEWSEDDEKKIMWLVRLISTGGFRELDSDKMPCSRSELLDWLKSIKPQPNQEWTEEDEGMLNLFLHKLEVCNLLTNKENIWIVNKLKSIKDRVQPQPKQEWSEEDERIRKYIIWHLGHTRTYPDNSINSHVEEAIAWLENQSIKNMEKDIEPKFMVGDTIRLKNSEAEYTITNIHDRCYYGKGWPLDIEKTDASDDWELVNSKQSCWKPTNEQMIAFRLLLDYNIGVFDYKNYMTVQSLYEDLQKNTEK